MSIAKTLTLIALPLFLVAAPTTQPRNLLTNGDFERQLTGWQNNGDAGMSRVIGDAAHSGARGLRVTDEDMERGSSLASTRLPTSPGKTYTVTFFGRSINGSSIGVYVQFFDKSGTLLNRAEIKNENVTHIGKGDDAESWQEYTSEPAIAPDDAATLRVWIHSVSKGTVTADFDDFRLTEVN